MTTQESFGSKCSMKEEGDQGVLKWCGYGVDEQRKADWKDLCLRSEGRGVGQEGERMMEWKSL